MTNVEHIVSDRLLQVFIHHDEENALEELELVEEKYEDSWK